MGGVALSRIVLAGLLAAILYVASLTLIPVERVAVIGNQHLSEAQVLATIGVYPGDPWLWATPGRAHLLEQNPWVYQAKLRRPRPGMVVIELKEKQPVATLKTPEGSYGVAADATLLPGAAPREPIISGFGENRLREALQIAALLPGVKNISYDPTGFTVNWKGRRLWIQDLQNLQVWLSRMDKLHGNNVAVYTWGVSIHQ